MSQPKALFLADVIKADPASKTHHDEAAAELRRLHALNAELLEALKNLEKEFRKVYPIYYYAEPWGHETNVPLQAARAAIAKAGRTDMTTWHKGPPPSIGWWPASTARDPNCLCWWNGERWSLPARPRMSEGMAAYWAKQLSGHLTSEIEWTDRPASWPERSKT